MRRILFAASFLFACAKPAPSPSPPASTSPASSASADAGVVASADDGGMELSGSVDLSKMTAVAVVEITPQDNGKTFEAGPTDRITFADPRGADVHCTVIKADKALGPPTSIEEVAAFEWHVPDSPSVVGKRAVTIECVDKKTKKKKRTSFTLAVHKERTIQEPPPPPP